MRRQETKTKTGTKAKQKLAVKKQTIRDLESKVASNVKGGRLALTQNCPPTGTCICQSDRNLKDNVVEIDVQDILTRLRMVPIQGWKYKWDTGSVKHIGPMAQDFFSAFGVGDDNKNIHLVDIGGVAFASIQALARMLDDSKKQIATLGNQISELKKRM